MNEIFVGKIVNTFGIKGELKVVSKFERAKDTFKVGNELLINGKSYKITGVRFHKNNYLVELDNIKDINLIEYLLGNDIYFNKNNVLNGENDYLISELVGYTIIDNDNKCGIVTDYDDNPINPLIKVDNKFFIPLKGYFIQSVNKSKKEIYTNRISELMF